MLDSIQPGKPGQEPQKVYQQKRRPKKRFSFRFKLGITILVLLVVGIFVGSRVVTLAQKFLDEGGVAKSFGQLFLAGDQKLAGEDAGEIRFLLLGIGGPGHDGGTLTDSIILVTLKVPNDANEGLRVSLVSVPRDLVVFIPGYEYRKINSAYAFGELNGQENGPRLALETVERVIGKSIPYYGVIDFEGFKKAVDELGGVEIYVEQGFTDSRFPDGENGFLPPITFEEGLQEMDGDRALKYVRSRHGTNNQGSDFSRSKRQQQLITSLWREISDINILTNFGLINRLLETVADHFRTNLELHEMKRLHDLTKKLKTQNISALAIDLQSGLVCNEINEENGAYILVPCEGLANYKKIRDIIDNQFVAGTLQKEQPIIEIQNASGVPQLAGQARNFLLLPNTQVLTTNYRGAARYQETVIYDNTSGGKPGSLEYLKDKLGVRLAASAFPFQTANKDADFVIIVTEDISTKINSAEN